MFNSLWTSMKQSNQKLSFKDQIMHSVTVQVTLEQHGCLGTLTPPHN